MPQKLIIDADPHIGRIDQPIRIGDVDEHAVRALERKTAVCRVRDVADRSHDEDHRNAERDASPLWIPPSTGASRADHFNR